MSSERHADAELKAALKAELSNTTAQRVLTLLAEAMVELVREDPDLRFYWAHGAGRTKALADGTGSWG